MTAYETICGYALRDVLPDLDALPDTVSVAFSVIKPFLDKAARRSTTAQNRKEKNAETADNSDSLGKEKDKEKVKYKDKEKDKNKYYNLYSNSRSSYGEQQHPQQQEQQAASGGGDREEIFLKFEEVFSQKPPVFVKSDVDKLLHDLDKEVILYAMDRAATDNVRKWNYARGILAKYIGHARTLQQALDFDRAYREKKGGNAQPPEKPFGQVSKEDSARALEQMRRIQEKFNS